MIRKNIMYNENSDIYNERERKKMKEKWKRDIYNENDLNEDAIHLKPASYICMITYKQRIMRDQMMQAWK